jgi:GDYXXLXY protein
MKKAASLAAFQIAVILGWAGYHENVRAHAPTFRIPLRPVDPYDVLRGRYFRLNPLDGNLKTGRPDVLLSEASVQEFLRGEQSYVGPVQVGFCPRGDLHRVCALRRLDHQAPAADGLLWSRAQAAVTWEASTYVQGKAVPEPGWRVSLNLGLNRFFLPNRITLPAGERDVGWALEVSHRPGQPLLPRRLWFRDQPVEVRD